MGRYYSGDIEGKFWFGVQSSDAPSRFGSEPCEPSYLEYYFDEDSLEVVEAEVNAIEREMGEYKEKLLTFFEDEIGYNDERLSKYLKVSREEVSRLLTLYADYGLGLQIRDCLREQGTCSFIAEL